MERSATSTKSAARDLCGDGIKVVNTLDQILLDPDVDCVVVATPNSTHYPYAKAVLEAGKHVIIEKPLVSCSRDADELIKISSSYKPALIIATYQNRRFDSDFLTVKKLLEQKALGDIHDFESRYDRYRPTLKGGTWKEEEGKGQGIVYDLGSHLIDQVLSLFGTPDTVFGTISNSRRLGPPKFDDSFIAHFYYHHPPGSSIPMTVTVRASPLSLLEPQLRFMIKGTTGSFVKYGIDPQEDQRKCSPPLPLSDPNFGVEIDINQGLLTSLNEGGTIVLKKVPTEVGRYITWYENVGAAIQARDQTKLHVKPEQARETIRIIELLYKSSFEGKVLPAKALT